MRAAGSLFGESPVLKLMYSAVIRAWGAWRGIRVTEFESAQLRKPQQQLAEEHDQEYSSKAQQSQTVETKPV